MINGDKHCFPGSPLPRSASMSSLNHLEMSGNLSDRPLAEILVELLDAQLDGSVRLSAHGTKAIIYVREGNVLFAVSNQRRHRIFQMLLDAGMITKQQLVEIADFTNDLVLANSLRSNGLFPESAIESVFTRQVESIFCEAVAWKEGLWTFTPLARIKDDLKCAIDVRGILIKYARELSRDAVVRRFKTFKESFGKRTLLPAQINLLPAEAFILSRFEGQLLRIEEIITMTGLPDADNLKGLYSLWLGGFVTRTGWNAAFSPKRINEIQSSRFELKPQAPKAPAVIDAPKPVVAEVNRVVEAPPVEAPKPKREISVEVYLNQIEMSETHYETLRIPIESNVDQIKKAYFALAKRFHPDLFYKNAPPALFRRIQDAFTQIAHAYETLRNEETRLRYDYRLKSILDELKRQGKGGINKEQPTTHKQLTEASEIFDHGFNMLMEEDYEAALPYITRAVSMAPDVARYHAYYGKVLSIDPSQKFKAESEIQTAIKLEPDNPMFRLMLAEFFIDFNLLKRAEGELNRLLATFPDNAEALAMLDSLR